MQCRLTSYNRGVYRLTGRLEQSQLADLFRGERVEASESVVLKLFHLKSSDAAYAKVVAAGGLAQAERLNVPDVSGAAAVIVLVAVCLAAGPLAAGALRRAEIP